MNDLDKSIHSEAMRLHNHVYLKLQELKEQHFKHLDLKAFVDSIYALKEADRVLEDIGKEVRRLTGLLEKMTCVAWTQKGDYEPIRTGLCTGSPDSKPTVKTPKAGTPEYAEFCKHFGIDPASPFRPHWPSMLAKISEDMAAGKPIPPGCDPNEIITQYVVTIRNKKGVGEGVVSDPELLKKQHQLLAAMRQVSTDPIASLILVLRDQQVLESKQTELDEDKEPVVAAVEEESPF